jgi:hypothetical protein
MPPKAAPLPSRCLGPCTFLRAWLQIKKLLRRGSRPPPPPPIHYYHHRRHHQPPKDLSQKAFSCHMFPSTLQSREMLERSKDHNIKWERSTKERRPTKKEWDTSIQKNKWMSKEIKLKQNKREREKWKELKKRTKNMGKKWRRYNYNTGIADSVRMFWPKNQTSINRGRRIMREMADIVSQGAEHAFSSLYYCRCVAVLGAVPASGAAELEGPLLQHKQQWRRRHSDCSSPSDNFWCQRRPGGSQREVLGRDPGAHCLLKQPAEVTEGVWSYSATTASTGQAKRERNQRTATVRNCSNRDLKDDIIPPGL